MNKQLDIFNAAKCAWQEDLSKSKTRQYSFDTISGETLDPLYYPNGDKDEYMEKQGFPGQYPFTRGIHANMYRGKLWTMRQFAGFGTPEETNERYHYLLKSGQTGLSVAYDMPTLMGYDPDHPFAAGEVGKCGVNVASLKDMERLFDGIHLADISVSQTINGPAVILLAFYIAVAENQGVPLENLQGTLQNDILKEFIAQKEWIFPPDPSMRIITDMMAFCSDNMPKFNTISISG
ncbi:MAG TPA: methylmalonyl-CoA mutase, partial [Candidatus Marinimicrobia bacterium]|nr:methylmalonyl-CoA mutase [Candidatus Neomarinimicrobiota bacterium]